MARLTSTLFFHNGVSGWSEKYWWGETDYDTIASNMRMAGGLFEVRMGLSTDSVKLDYARISDDEIRGDSLLVPVVGYTHGTFGSEGDKSTEPWSALIMRWAAAPTSYVTRFLHGLPQSQVTEGFYTPTMGWLTAFDAYTAFAMANLRIFAKDRTVGGPRVLSAILAITTGNLTTRHVGRPFGLPRGRRTAA